MKTYTKAEISLAEQIHLDRHAPAESKARAVEVLRAVNSYVLAFDL